jgi:glycosyltransferase involved in cell wall biosynthesis
MAVRQRGFTVVCCTGAYIYHYAQTSEGRTADDARNLARLVSKWARVLRIDEDEYFRHDAQEIARSAGDSTVQMSPTPSASQEVSRSPYWLGTRVSVALAVGEPSRLPVQFEALARQTILPDEFELVIVDYGSGAEEGDSLRQLIPCAVHYHRLADDPSAGAARNTAVTLARGELIVFLDDTCVASDRLLEEHLLAHAREPALSSAVVGRFEWSTPPEHQTVIAQACPPGVRVLDAPRADIAEHELTRLDVGNVSFKRAFLSDAWAAGIRIEPSLTLTASQGADLAVRLTPRGLRVHIAPDARAYRQAPDRFEDVFELECAAGADAVTLYRAHPDLDRIWRVKWLPDSDENTRRLLRHPEARAQVVEIAERLETLNLTLIRTLDELVRLTRLSTEATASIGFDQQRLVEALRAAVDLARKVRRARGKIRAWYGQASDPDMLSAADALSTAACMIEWLAAHDGDAAAQPAGVLLGRRIENAEEQSGRREQRDRVPLNSGAIRGAVIMIASRTGMKSRLRALDAFIEARLSRRKNGRWLARYVAARARVRPFFA